MIKLRNFVKKRTQNENGEADIIVTLFMVPFAVFLIFALINMSMYFQARSVVENIARDGARQVALYGGAAANVPLNNTGSAVSDLVFNRLYANGGCTQSNCTAPPRVTCTPNQASAAGQSVTCTITYYFSPIANDWFGFAAITAQPFTVTGQTISETGY
jgi:Flp pilus assembly protein TadG